MNINPKTIFNLLSIFNIHATKIVSKKIAHKRYITNEFVDDRFPELNWFIVYDRSKTGYFNSQFDVVSIEINDSEGNLIFLSKKEHDSSTKDDMSDDGELIASKYVKNKSDSIQNITKDFITIYGE